MAFFWTASAVTSRVMRSRPSAFAACAAASRPVSAIRASPPDIETRCAIASSSASSSIPPSPRSAIPERPQRQRPDGVVVQRLEPQEETSREQRGVEREVRVLGGGPDQRDGSLLHRWEQDVLLRLRPAVHLVDEQDRAEEATLAPSMTLRASATPEFTAEIWIRSAPDRVGEQVRERGLAGAGGPPQDDGGEVPSREDPREGLAFADQVALPGELLEGAGAHPGGERLVPHGADYAECSTTSGRTR